MWIPFKTCVHCCLWASLHHILIFYSSSMKHFYCFRVTQFIGETDTLLADSITGLINHFENYKNTDINSFVDPSDPIRRNIQKYETFRPSEKEYYTYSELPRAYWYWHKHSEQYIYRYLNFINKKLFHISINNILHMPGLGY